MSDQRRKRRGYRARVVNVKRMAQDNAGAGYLQNDHRRPTTRAECANGPRPCPFVSCRHHLYLDVSPHTGAIKLNFPDLEVWEIGETCSLDIAERGGVPQEAVSQVFNVSRERVRQLEVAALREFEDRAGLLAEELPPDAERPAVVTPSLHTGLTGAQLRAKMLAALETLELIQSSVAADLGVTPPGFNRWLHRDRARDVRDRITPLVVAWLDAHPFHDGTSQGSDGSIMERERVAPLRKAQDEGIASHAAA